MTAPAKPLPASPAEERAPEDLRLWLSLLACAHTAEQRVKARIKQHFGINQTQFNLLSQLDRAPDGIRMGELSERTVVTGSNVTVVVEDLLRRGLVTRESPAEDRRAIVIRLSSAGRAAYSAWAPIHAVWVAEIFGGLDSAQKAELIERLAGLKAAMGATLRNSFAPCSSP